VLSAIQEEFQHGRTEDDGEPQSKGSKRFARSAICILLRGSPSSSLLPLCENLGRPTSTVPRRKTKGEPAQPHADAIQAIVLEACPRALDPEDGEEGVVD
jgi:hypothetical protein